MIIYTDSKSYAEHILNLNTRWQKDSNPDNPLIRTLKDALLGVSGIHHTKIQEKGLWEYGFITEYAASSQFLLINNLLKKHTLTEGVLCLAQAGNNFVGYRNRKWQTLKGNIHLSLFFNPNRQVPFFNVGFTILSTVAIIEALDNIAGLNKMASIKWVNDIFIKGGKVAGVLTQTQTKGNTVTGVFLGIGLNVKVAPEIESDNTIPKAACLMDFVNVQQDLSEGDILLNLLDKIGKNYDLLLTGDYDALLYKYRSRSLIIGKKVEIYSDPVAGKPQMIRQGIIKDIGRNLELFFEDNDPPVRTGRAKIIG